MFKLENEELIQESKIYSGRVECLTLKIKDDFVLYGDLMNSLTVLRYNPTEQQFEEVKILTTIIDVHPIVLQIAHDVHPQWTTTCEFIDDDTFLSAEDSGNLISCHKNSSSTKEQERNILNQLGLYHLGEQINTFQHGKNLLSPHPSYLSNPSRLSCNTTKHRIHHIIRNMHSNGWNFWLYWSLSSIITGIVSITDVIAIGLGRSYS